MEFESHSKPRDEFNSNSKTFGLDEVHKKCKKCT